MPFILLFILLAAGTAAYIYFSKNADRYSRRRLKTEDPPDVIYLPCDTQTSKPDDKEEQ